MTDFDVTTDNATVSRRNAMKAALGGAAAAAVMAAPRIGSVSQTPAYAQQSTTCDDLNAVTNRFTSTGASGSDPRVNYCWGGYSSPTVCVDGSTGTVPIGTLNDSYLGVYSGSPFTGDGQVFVKKVNGTRDCTVRTANEACGVGAGAWTGDSAVYPLTTTGVVIALTCSASCTDCQPYGAYVDLVVSCDC